MAGLLYLRLDQCDLTGCTLTLDSRKGNSRTGKTLKIDINYPEHNLPMPEYLFEGSQIDDTDKEQLAHTNEELEQRIKDLENERQELLVQPEQTDNHMISTLQSENATLKERVKEYDSYVSIVGNVFEEKLNELNKVRLEEIQKTFAVDGGKSKQDKVKLLTDSFKEQDHDTQLQMFKEVETS